MCDWEEGDGQIVQKKVVSGAEEETNDDSDLHSIPGISSDMDSDGESAFSEKSSLSVESRHDAEAPQKKWPEEWSFLNGCPNPKGKNRPSVDGDDVDTIVSPEWNFKSEVYRGVPEERPKTDSNKADGERGASRCLENQVKEVSSGNIINGNSHKEVSCNSAIMKGAAAKDDDGWEEGPGPVNIAGTATGVPQNADDGWEDDIVIKIDKTTDDGWIEDDAIDQSSKKQENCSSHRKENWNDWEPEHTSASVNGNQSTFRKSNDYNRQTSRSSRGGFDSSRGRGSGSMNRGAHKNGNNNFRKNGDGNTGSSQNHTNNKTEDEAWDEINDAKQQSDVNSGPFSHQNNSRGGRRDYNNSFRGRGGSSDRQSGSGNRGRGSRSGSRMSNGSYKNGAKSESGDWGSDTGGSETSRRSSRPQKFPFIPEPLPEGDELFIEREECYEGVGDHFDELDEVRVSATENYEGLSPFSTFDEMNLPTVVLENVKRLSYKKPTPVQKYGSSVMDAQKDLMACAQNGTGKTAGFLLPILKGLLSDPKLSRKHGFDKSVPSCLILSPTRELAIQIAKEAHMYAKGTDITTVCIYGGTCLVNMESRLRSGCQIIVATPGRLMQAIRDGLVELNKVKYFVLDEADRMLDLGFMEIVNKLVECLPPKEERISAMFSATFPEKIQEAAQAYLREYVFVIIGILGSATTEITQEFLEVSREEKTATLIKLLQDENSKEKAIVFCATRIGTDYLASILSKNEISATCIHGDRLQIQREQALREFMKDQRRVLVATAVAARGLDIPKVSLVINFDLPSDIDEYVHRIGRTGRIGHEGRSISFYDRNEDSHLVPHLIKILKDAQQNIPEFLKVDGVAVSGSVDSEVIAIGETDAGEGELITGVVEEWDGEDDGLWQ